MRIHFLKKYGKPTYSDPLNRGKYWWVYDIGGSLQKHDSFKINDQTLCLTGGPNPSNSNKHGRAPTELYKDSKENIAKRSSKLRNKCGRIALYADIGTNDYKKNDNSFVGYYSIELFGYEEYIRSSMKAKDMVDEEVEKKRVQAIRNANSITLDL